MRRAEIRARILADHDEIRDVLDEIDRLRQRFEQDGSDVGEEIRRVGVGLIEVFAVHLDLEESLLLPVLQTVPERGEQMAARLAHEHKEQRELLDYLMNRLEQSTRPTTLITRELGAFASYVRADMDHEESTILRENLLR